MKTRPVIIRSEADADIQAIYDELETAQSGLGRRFIATLRGALERIESMPEMYGMVWRDVRAVRLRRFQYVLYYLVLSDCVEVLAVIHGSRDGSIWRSRT